MKTYRKRRRENAKLKFGEKAVRPHHRKGGRTGSIRAKSKSGKGVCSRSWHPNPSGPTCFDLGGSSAASAD